MNVLKIIFNYEQSLLFFIVERVDNKHTFSKEIGIYLKS